MKNNQTIVAVTVLVCGQFDTQQAFSFEEKRLAANFINDYLKTRLKEINTALGIPEDSLTKKQIVIRNNSNQRDIFDKKEGNLSYTIADHDYEFAFLNVPGDHSVSDNEIVSVLDGFVNSNRSNVDYKKVALNISQEMHRYCQNELWKFIKQIIAAFACGRYDQRNQTAYNQAQRIQQVIEEENL